ncbi:hypothetical protein KVR01_009900 [Diaporthe batatas]|uniref:uncharacterized protein n=1 Tax=Diaporthe batatas TaxID=748121 RepID=UPI001D0479FA|nr:uncharacterized protein KVR01_009900 [Diaporthe batatas]KAG8160364.1 hypothetical protein KVR01_009900 [Diaporthe batatas]
MERVQTTQEDLPDFRLLHMTQVAELEVMSRRGIQIDLPIIEYKDKAHTPLFVIHSGGTTGLPKPVARHVYQDLIILGRHIANAETDMLITLPAFHSFGFAHCIAILWGKFRLSVLNASRPVTAPVILKALDITNSKALATVPHLLKFVNETPGGAERLAQLKSVAVTGAATPEVLGNELVEKGVAILSPYGQSESGPLMYNCTGRDWIWLMAYPWVEPYVTFEPYGDEEQGVWHLIVLPGLSTLATSNRPDGSYATQDLFVRHPTDPKKWKFSHRADDIIVLVNGLKADPHLLEQAVEKNPDVDAAMAFGTGRDSLGLIVVPLASASGLSTEELAARIAPDLELGNSRVSAYTRVSLDSVIFRQAGSQVPRTAKETLIRSKFLELCKDDIEAHYAAREAQDQAHISVADDEVEGIVREVVSSVLSAGDAKVSAEDDFFMLGMDSLQASYVRSRLLRRVNVGGHPLPTNVVFEHPTVRQLTEFVLALRNSQDPNGTRISERAIAEGLIQKYTRFPPTETRTVETGPGRVVLLTGATGFIGRHILHRLISWPNVDRVYCLVRADSDEAAELRITESLREARLEVADCEARLRVIALASDAGHDHLGLGEKQYESLRTTVTNIIHAAWAVNFNMSLSSFESSIASVSRLLELSISSPLHSRPTFSFLSSIATIMRAREQGVVKETRYGWEAITPMGYGQSKWVAEEICSAAAKYAAQKGINLPIQVLRVGQVVGDTKHGIWNSKEAVPLTVQSALSVGALPLVEGDDVTSWLPVDIAGTAVVELALRDRSHDDAREARVFHVSSTEPLKWNTEFLPALKRNGLSFEAVPGPEWVRLLESAVPNHRLLQHFKTRYGAVGGDSEFPQRVLGAFDMSEAQKFSSALRKVPEIDEKQVGRLLQYWMGLEEWKSIQKEKSLNGRGDSGIGRGKI